jgi:hypothetical protein
VAQVSSTTQAPAAGAPVKDTGFDTDRFPDEDKFLTFFLDAGALRQLPDGGELSEGDLPSKQRLYNLGFGQNDPAHWTDEEFETAVRQYRRFRGIGKDSNIDAETRRSLKKDHELSDPGPPAEDDGPGEPDSPDTTAGTNLELCAGTGADFAAGTCPVRLSDSGGPGFVFLTIVDTPALSGKIIYVIRAVGIAAATFRLTVE